MSDLNINILERLAHDGRVYVPDNQYIRMTDLLDRLGVAHTAFLAGNEVVIQLDIKEEE